MSASPPGRCPPRGPGTHIYTIWQYLQYLRYLAISTNLHTRDGFLSEAPLEGYIDLLVARVSFYASWIQVKLLQNLKYQQYLDISILYLCTSVCIELDHAAVAGYIT